MILADLDRCATAANARLLTVLVSPKTRRLIRAVERRTTRAALKHAAAPTPPPVIRARGTFAIPTTPRFRATTTTKDRIEQIDAWVRNSAIKYHCLDGVPVDQLAAYFQVRPRSIEAMLRRNADLHTLRIYQKRVKLSTQDTLDLIDRQRSAHDAKGIA